MVECVVPAAISQDDLLRNNKLGKCSEITHVRVFHGLRQEPTETYAERNALKMDRTRLSVTAVQISKPSSISSNSNSVILGPMDLAPRHICKVCSLNHISDRCPLVRFRLEELLEYLLDLLTVLKSRWLSGQHSWSSQRKQSGSSLRTRLNNLPSELKEACFIKVIFSPVQGLEFASPFCINLLLKVIPSVKEKLLFIVCLFFCFFKKANSI